MLVVVTRINKKTVTRANAVMVTIDVWRNYHCEYHVCHIRFGGIFNIFMSKLFVVVKMDR